MFINNTPVIPNATNITVTTALSSCDNSTLDVNRTVHDLWNFYQSSRSNLTSNVFLSVSIINLNCTRGAKNYFEQIITFSQLVSIRIQILFASIYFDYINANDYHLNGFIIDRETYLNLSSITTNNSAESNACSSAEAAQELLCQTNSVCTVLTNRWNYICSEHLLATTNNVRPSQTSGLNSWQLGLICGFSILIVLLLILVSGYFYRRYTHSKQLALSHVNLYDDTKPVQKSGIPEDPAFQRATTLVQPTRSNNTAISWINGGTATKTGCNNENYINLKLHGPSNQVTFVDHAKIHDPNIPQELKASVHIPTSSLNGTLMSRPVSRASMNQLKLITGGLYEDKLNESDNISLDQSMSSSPKQPNSTISRQLTNVLFIDENLCDEDAWMSILEVVNAELAILDQQDRISTSL